MNTGDDTTISKMTYFQENPGHLTDIKSFIGTTTVTVSCADEFQEELK